MPDDMSNLMKIFIRDDEDTESSPHPEPLPQDTGEPADMPSHAAPEQAPPSSPLPAPAPRSKPSEAALAAARLQQMILNNSMPETQPTPQRPATPPLPPMPSRPAPVAAPEPVSPEALAPEPIAKSLPPAPVPVDAPSIAEPRAPEPVESDSVAASDPTPRTPAQVSVADALQAIAFRVDSLPNGKIHDGRLISRIGPDGLAFVHQALELAEREEGLLPRSFDLEEFRSQGNVLRDLATLSCELDDLAQRVRKAEAAIGSDAFARALRVYQAAKMANSAADLEGLLGR